MLIDEYQDCNQVQMDIVFALTRHTGQLTVVGDDAQAIYRFRGSMPGIFGVGAGQT